MSTLSWALLPLSVACWLWAALRIFPDAVASLNAVRPAAAGYAAAGTGTPRAQLDSHRDALAPPGDGSDNIFYFAQISDLHVSHHKHGHLGNLRRFLRDILPAVAPEFVVVTGDLTDAKEKKRWGSHQFLDEWRAYEAILREYGVLDRPAGFWWDQRGNHDCFAVSGWDSAENYFRNFSATKEDRYGFVFERPYGSYSFIGVDACPVYGPGRPFNFFGYFDTADMDFLQSQLSKHAARSNHTFVMSHYPISTTMTGYTSDGVGFSQLASQFSLFLCGHLHKLAGGLGNVLHAHHPEQFLELELADMKENGQYRVVAVDHDLISFNEGSVNNSAAPLIVITNPKDARYAVPAHEPLHRIAKSSHIRWLAFGNTPVASTAVSIDGVPLMNAVKFVGRVKGHKDGYLPLYATRWNPLLYNDGRPHVLEITVTNDNGLVSSKQSTFRVDGRRMNLDIGAGGYIMSARFHGGIRFLFIMFYVTITVFLLLIPKLISIYLHRSNRYLPWRISYSHRLVDLDRPKLISLPRLASVSGIVQRIMLWIQAVQADFVYFCHATLFRLVTLASVPHTFYPLYAYGLYVIIGPYFIGELIPLDRLTAGTTLLDALGSFYLYGVYVEHKWIPMVDTWLFGLFELIYLFGPMVIYLSFCITPAEQLYAPRPSTEPAKNQVYFPHRHNRRQDPLHRRLSVRLMVAVVVFYQFVNIFFIGFCYGIWAAVLSPGKTWFVLWSCYKLFVHRWSAQGHEIDLWTESDLRSRERIPLKGSSTTTAAVVLSDYLGSTAGVRRSSRSAVRSRKPGSG